MELLKLKINSSSPRNQVDEKEEGCKDLKIYPSTICINPDFIGYVCFNENGVKRGDITLKDGKTFPIEMNGSLITLINLFEIPT